MSLALADMLVDWCAAIHLPSLAST